MAQAMEKAHERKTAAATRQTSPFEEMEALLSEFFPRRWPRRFGWQARAGDMAMEQMNPRVDVIDRDEEIVLRAEVAGVDKEDLEVSLTDNTVSISGSARREEAQEEGEYYRCEIAGGAFSRTVALPGTIDPEQSTASFDKGVLELHMPKMNKSRRKRIALD